MSFCWMYWSRVISRFKCSVLNPCWTGSGSLPKARSILTPSIRFYLFLRYVDERGWPLSALTSRSAGHRWPGGPWRCWSLQLGPPPRTASRRPQPSSVWRRWRWRRRSRSLHLQAAAGCSAGASPRALATLRGFAAVDRAAGGPSCSHWEGWRWNCCRRGVDAGSSWWEPGGTDGSPNVLRGDATQQLDVQQDRMTRLLSSMCDVAWRETSRAPSSGSTIFRSFINTERRQMSSLHQETWLLQKHPLVIGAWSLPGRLPHADPPHRGHRGLFLIILPSNRCPLAPSVSCVGLQPAESKSQTFSLGCQVPVNTVCPASLPVILKEGQPAIRVKLAAWVHTLPDFKIKAQKQSAAENTRSNHHFRFCYACLSFWRRRSCFYGDDGADEWVLADH